MNGKYDKNAIKNIVEPLKAMTAVFNSPNDNVHVVYESEEDGLYISVTNAKKSIYAMYNLATNGVITDWNAEKKEIGIWDVQQFVNIIGRYDSPLYKDDVVIKSNDNKLEITCGKDRTDFSLAQLHLFDDIRGKRRLKTEALTEAVSFKLSGDILKRLQNNINVFADQDEITLSGKKGENELKVSLTSSSSTIFTKNESVLENVTVNENFKLTFPKSEFKGVFSCNDSFDINVYTGAKSIVGINYKRMNYDMKFYFAPLADK